MTTKFKVGDQVVLTESLTGYDMATGELVVLHEAGIEGTVDDIGSYGRVYVKYFKKVGWRVVWTMFSTMDINLKPLGQ